MSEHERVDVEADRPDEGDFAVLHDAAKAATSRSLFLNDDAAQRFHEAANPPMVLALLDKHAALVAEVVEVRRIAEHCRRLITGHQREVGRLRRERDAAIERAERAEAVVAKVRELAVRLVFAKPHLRDEPIVRLLALLPDDEGGR